jgi:hypothetical protein
MKTEDHPGKPRSASSGRQLVTVTTDFGRQGQAVGILEAVVFAIAPKTKFIHFMHGLPRHDTIAAGRTLETLAFVPVGYHVCVCDPGVGTRRRALALQTARGDVLIGPDNGVLVPGCLALGGLVSAFEITNGNLMLPEVSPLFHGRDIFVPVAAHLSNGIPVASVGAQIDLAELSPAPYTEARIESRVWDCRVIQVNHFGSLHLNVRHACWDKVAPPFGDPVTILLPSGEEVPAVFGRTFADVAEGAVVLLKDDYGRIEIAINRGSFAGAYGINIGDPLAISLPSL